MSASLALQRVWKDQAIEWREYLVTFSGNYTNQANGGEIIDFTKAANPNNQPHAIPGRAPTLYGVSNEPQILAARIIPGTGINNWSLQITYQTGAGGAFVEKTNGEAYSATDKADANFAIRIGSKALI